MSDSFFERQIAAKGQQLTTHPLYKHLQSLNDLRTFMEFHVFAVWDFMSLVKRLQREFTTINLPWQPSPYPEKLVRTVNEIVLSEESDLDPHGQPMSHFNMYITAMDEVGANTQPILSFLKNQEPSLLPQEVRKHVQWTLSVATTGDLIEVLGAFFWGREKIIPDMFRGIINGTNKTQTPKFTYYIERHIDLDGKEHGPVAELFLETACGTNQLAKDRAFVAAIKSLERRIEMWDLVLRSIKLRKASTPTQQDPKLLNNSL